MEDYLRNVKSFLSQMNDFEDQAANISAEEEKQKTAIQAVEKDIELGKAEHARLQAQTDEMLKAKALIHLQIAEKKKKLLAFETESSTLSQTLELLQQEKASLSQKLKEKSAYYTKTTENMISALQEQQDWFNSHKLNDENERGVLDQIDSHATNGHSSERDFDGPDVQLEGYMNDITTKLESEKDKLADMKQKQSDLSLERSKAKSTIDHLTCRSNDFPPELKQMDMKALEDEYKAILSDKAGEQEYLQSLQRRIGEIESISDIVKCPCGEEYTVQPKSDCSTSK